MATAQDIDVSKYREHYHVSVKKISQPIKLDGELDEAGWLQSQPANDFWLKFPRDDAKANHKTEAKVLYDD